MHNSVRDRPGVVKSGDTPLGIVKSFAIVQRELAVAGRRRSTYWSRCLVAGVMAAVAAGFLGSDPYSGSGMVSHLIFRTLVWIGFAGAFLAGVLLTSDALSSERREGTLGLLFLTELTGLDVAMGKLVASSVQGSFALMGALPVIAIPFLLGGVSFGQFWGSAGVLAALLLASLGCGIFASAISRESNQAFGLTLLSLTLLCTLPLLAAWLVSTTGWTHLSAVDFGRFSPVWLIQAASQSTAAPSTLFRPIFIGSLGVAMVGLSGLAGAAWWLGRHGRTEWAEATVRPIPRQPFKSKTARHAWDNSNNLYAEFYQSRLSPSPALQWFWRLSLVAWLIAYAGSFVGPSRSSQTFFMFAIGLSYTLHLLFKIQVAQYAAVKLAEEVASGAMELLLVTPLRPVDILAGHQRAIWQAIRRQLRTLLAVNVALMFTLVNANLQIRGEDGPTFSFAYMGGLILMGTDAAALIARGAWVALQPERPARALAATLWPVVLPTPVGIFGIILMAFSGTSGDSAPALILALEFIWIICSLTVTNRYGPLAQEQFLQRHSEPPSR